MKFFWPLLTLGRRTMARRSPILGRWRETREAVRGNASLRATVLELPEERMADAGRKPGVAASIC